MNPIYCTTYDGYSACLIRLGYTLVFPVTSSFGFSTDENIPPTPDSILQCNCSSSDINSIAFNRQCNVFDILIGAIFYNPPSTTATGSMALTTNPGTIFSFARNATMAGSASESSKRRLSYELLCMECNVEDCCCALQCRSSSIQFISLK